MEQMQEKNFNINQIKGKNKKYIKELQKFFDIVDNIEKEELKMDIIYQMLKCDNVLSEMIESEIKK